MPVSKEIRTINQDFRVFRRLIGNKLTPRVEQSMGIAPGSYAKLLKEAKELRVLPSQIVGDIEDYSPSLPLESIFYAPDPDGLMIQMAYVGMIGNSKIGLLYLKPDQNMGEVLGGELKLKSITCFLKLLGSDERGMKTMSVPVVETENNIFPIPQDQQLMLSQQIGMDLSGGLFLDFCKGITAGGASASWPKIGTKDAKAGIMVKLPVYPNAH